MSNSLISNFMWLMGVGARDSQDVGGEGKYTRCHNGGVAGGGRDMSSFRIVSLIVWSFVCTRWEW